MISKDISDSVNGILKLCSCIIIRIIYRLTLELSLFFFLNTNDRRKKKDASAMAGERQDRNPLSKRK